MKLSYLLSTAAILLLLPFSLKAQAVVEGIEDFSKKQRGNALSITIDGQTKNVTAVMDELFLAGTGEKPRAKSGVKSMENARYADISSKSFDYFYKVEKPSRGDKLHSKVTLFISSGNGNFINSEEFPEEIQAATSMLEGLQLNVRIYEMDLLIGEQEKLIEKEEKKQEGLERDSAKLEQLILDTQAKLEQNKAGQSDQRSKIRAEKDRLEAFRLQLDELKNKRDNPGVMTNEEELMDALDEESGGDDGGSDDDGGGK